MLLMLHRLGVKILTIVALLVLTRVLRITSTAGNVETLPTLPCLITRSR